MNNLEQVLYQVFDSLRRRNVPIGISEYLAIIDLVKSGIGVESPEALGRICKLLWAKSLQDQELFDLTFQEYMRQFRQRAPREREERQLTGAEEEYPKEMTEIAEHLPGKSPQESPGPITQPSIPPPSSLMPLPEVSLSHGMISRSFQVTPRMPIDAREMASVWRHFRRLKRTGPLIELDIDATIEQICSTGFFTRPVLRPLRRNEARLLLLIDVKGSMAPFAPFMKTVVNSIERAGLLGKVKTFFFHNAPHDYLYLQPTLVDVFPLKQGMEEFAPGNGVLILSDAGAARRNYSKSRLDVTRAFISRLAQFTYLYAWLNPLPAWRWSHTTAAEIARLVPMFPITREGLNDALGILCGHPFPAGVQIYE